MARKGEFPAWQGFAMVAAVSAATFLSVWLLSGEERRRNDLLSDRGVDGIATVIATQMAPGADNPHNYPELSRPFYSVTYRFVGGDGRLHEALASGRNPELGLLSEGQPVPVRYVENDPSISRLQVAPAISMHPGDLVLMFSGVGVLGFAAAALLAYLRRHHRTTGT